MISTKDIMNLGSWHGLVRCSTWIWLRKGHFCQQVDNLITFSCWVIQGTNLSPALPHISVSIWEHLAQNHTMFSKLLSICFSGDDWGHSLKIIVNYEDDYLKHHNVNRTVLFLMIIIVHRIGYWKSTVPFFLTVTGNAFHENKIDLVSL